MIRSEVMPVVICIYLSHIYLFTFIAEHSNWYCYNLSLLMICSEVMPVVICIYLSHISHIYLFIYLFIKYKLFVESVAGSCFNFT